MNGVDVDAGDLEAARQLVQAAIEYMEQELGVPARQPAPGRLDRTRLWVLRRDLDRLAALIAPGALTISDIVTT